MVLRTKLRHTLTHLSRVFFASIVVVLTSLPVSAQTPTAVDNASVHINPSLPLASLGKRLTDDGIYITANYNLQFAGNPSGGQRQGADYSARLALGAAFDLGKIVGIQGGLIHLVFADDTGKNLSADTINSDATATSLYSGPQTYQLSILTYEQRLFNDRININVGRTDLAFLNSDLYCYFMSRGQCGRPSALFKTVTASLYPTAIWGGRILLRPIPNFYVKTGIYQPNADLRPKKSHGLDWGIKSSGAAGGYDFPIETGYTAKNNGSPIENQYDIGYIDSHVPFSAPFYNSKHPLHSSRKDVYLQAQQRIYQPIKNSPRGVFVFAYDVIGASGGVQVAHYQLTSGAVWIGPFAARPMDRTAIIFNDYHLNSRYLNSLYATRVKEGGTERPWHDQDVLECNYLFQVNRWLQIEPDFQYLIHPDGLGFSSPYPKKNLPSAVVLGFQMNISLTALAGLPSYSLSAQQDN